MERALRTRLGTALLAGALAASALAAPRTATAQGTSATAADADAKDRSRAAFRKGVQQLRAQDWTAARASFETAWSLFPHPSILLNLGIARMKTDDPVRAEQDFVRFLSEDFGASQEELAAARDALAEVRGKLGTLKVVASPVAARIQLDGKTVEAVRRGEGASGGESIVAEVRTKPGRHAVAVEADGFVAQTRDVDVAPKGEATVTIVLPVDPAKAPKPARPPEAEEPSSPARAIVGWSMVGLATAGVVTGTVCALNAKSLSDDYGDPSSPGFQKADTRSEGVTFRTSADIAFGVAIAAGATAIVLLLTDVGKGGPSAANVARHRSRRPFEPFALRW